MDKIREREIIEKILNGDKQAFTAVVDTYKNIIYNLAYRMTGSTSDAEDLTQETFIRAYQNLWRFQPHKNFFTWLYTIALNVIKNYNKKNRVVSFAEPFSFTTPVQDDSAENKMIERQELSAILLKLDEELRALLIMKYLMDLSFEEIAEITGKSVSSVKMIIYRGLEKIRKYFIVADIPKCQLR